MGWTYRVIRRVEEAAPGESEVYYTIAEVYDHGAWTAEPMHPQGESRYDLLKDLARMQVACGLPSLEERDGALVEVDRAVEDTERREAMRR